jgi:MoxR-like ATPase
MRAAKASAALQGRGYVVPDDVHALAPMVLTHRLLPSSQAAITGRTVGDILGTLLDSVPVPSGPTSPAPARQA